MTTSLGRVALLSLEPWDEVWRRNQHLARQLVSSGRVDRLIFVAPPGGGLAIRAMHHVPIPGVEVVTPPLIIPRRFGGHRVIARWLRRQLSGVDLIWVNDAIAGRGVVALGIPLVYDVTDDWRSMPQRAADRSALIAAEDVLAERARTVVCSDVLAERWRERYGIEATVVPNGVDVDAIRSAEPRDLDEIGSHAIYVGTLHTNRLDIDLVEAIARDRSVTVHLVGPDHLDEQARTRLRDMGVAIHGPVASADVPSWLVAADVLICPHIVDDFTFSLDAIKAHEYLATDRPIVATPTSGFQAISAPGLTVASNTAFVNGVRAAAGTGPYERLSPPSWAHRAAAFAEVLLRTRSD